MKGLLKGIAFAAVFFSAAAQAAPEPFQTTYTELFSEFPNFDRELKDVPPLVAGNKRRSGSISIANGLLIFDAEGKNFPKLEMFAVGMLVSSQTTSEEIAQLSELNDTFIRTLTRSDKAYWVTKQFIDKEVTRQSTILRAGGTPKPGIRNFGKNQVSVSVVKGSGMMAITHSFHRES